MKHQADRKKEKGIALLLTLGIMALLLISAMSFSFQALTDRMAAANNANATRARLLARGGLERAIGALKFRCDGGESPDPLTAMSYPENLYPGTATTKALFATPKDNIWGANRYFWCSTNPTGQTRDQFGLETALAVDLDFAYTPSYATQVAVGDPSTTLADRASWQHVSMSETSVGRDLNGDGDTSDSVLTGRFSFLAIDDSGKLDPGSLITPAGEPYIDTNGNGSYTAGEFYLDYNQNGSYTSGTGINEATPGALPRFGWSPEEICLDYDEFRTDAPAGATDWFSWKHLTELPWSLSSTSSALATYSPHNDSIIDAYRNAGDTTDYQRMNLWDIDWDTTDWTNATNFGWLSSTARDFYSNPATKTINAQASPGDADGGAPWLGLSGTNVSTQVKLNLIDFCDTDSAASVYTDGTSGDTCYGLEKVPYINEVGVTAVYSHIEFLGSTILAQVIVTVNVELVNIYDEDILIQPSSCDLTLDVDGTTRTITVPIDDGSGNAITVTKNSYAIFSFSDNYNVNNGAATNDPVT
ncbi:MAG: hypothetical protein KAI66_24935, partial [Lentisphaeria bacterium]|nr:hypothetical protein [Lentisphaeria bacterium]